MKVLCALIAILLIWIFFGSYIEPFTDDATDINAVMEVVANQPMQLENVVLHDPFQRVIKGVPVKYQPYRLVDTKFASATSLAAQTQAGQGVEQYDNRVIPSSYTNYNTGHPNQIANTPDFTVERVLVDTEYVPRRIRPPQGPTGFPHPCDPSPVYTDKFNTMGRYMGNLPEKEKQLIYHMLNMPEMYFSPSLN